MNSESIYRKYYLNGKNNRIINEKNQNLKRARNISYETSSFLRITFGSNEEKQ